jgi:hypothetical protein
MRIFARTLFRLGDAYKPQHLHRTSLRRLPAKALMDPQVAALVSRFSGNRDNPICVIFATNSTYLISVTVRG